MNDFLTADLPSSDQRVDLTFDECSTIISAWRLSQGALEYLRRLLSALEDCPEACRLLQLQDATLMDRTAVGKMHCPDLDLAAGASQRLGTLSQVLAQRMVEREAALGLWQGEDELSAAS